MGLPFQLGVGGGNRQQTNQQKDYQVVINAKVKIKQGEGTEWLEAFRRGGEGTPLRGDTEAET